MSLKQYHAETEAARAAGGEDTRLPTASVGQAQFLLLVRTTGQRWLLPWSCFHGLALDQEAGDNGEKCELLHLVFMRHDVLVRGRNLNGVAEIIRQGSLGELRELPEKYHPVATASNKAVISSIEVRLR